jgi:hypothetical protein
VQTPGGRRGAEGGVEESLSPPSNGTRFWRWDPNPCDVTGEHGEELRHG